MSDTPERLLGLASAAVGALSQAEKEVVTAAARGVVAALGAVSGQNAVVRAEVIRWLCGGEASGCVDARGIRIAGATVPGTLDLSSMTVSAPLELRKCSLETLAIARATLVAVVLDESTLASVEGEGARVTDDFSCRGCTIASGVCLLNAELGGDVKLTGAAVGSFAADPRYDDDRVVVDLNGANVAGSVYVDRGFAADGEVRLRGCTLGEGVEAREAELKNLYGTALDGDRAHIGGTVFLQEAHVWGEVHLPLSRIAGEVLATGAEFRNPRVTGPTGKLYRGCSLSLTGSEIGGDVRLDGAFVAEGYMRMVGTRIDGNLIARGRFEGDVRAEVGTEAGSDRFALNGNRLNVRGNAFLEGGTFIGGVSLIGAQVTADLELNGAELLLGTRPESRMALPWVLRAERLTVGGTLSFCEHLAGEKAIGFHADGLLDLRLAQVGANLRFVGARFAHAVGAGAIGTASTATAETRRLGMHAEHIRVERELEWTRVTGATEVSLEHASVGRLDDDRKSWQGVTTLSLDGFSYQSLCMDEAKDWPPRNRSAREFGIDLWAWVRGNNVAGTYRHARIEWLERAGEFHPRRYDQLSTALRNVGFEDDARRVQVEKGKRAWRDEKSFAGWVRSFVLHWVLGSGYQPSRALWWSLGVILLGWLVYALGNNEGLLSPEKQRQHVTVDVRARATPPGDSAQVPSFSPLAYSVDVFLPIVNLHQEDYWHPNARLRCLSGAEPIFPRVTCGRLLRYYHWTHILVGWVLTTLAVAGFTGLVRRQ